MRWFDPYAFLAELRKNEKSQGGPAKVAKVAKVAVPQRDELAQPLRNFAQVGLAVPKADPACADLRTPCASENLKDDSVEPSKDACKHYTSGFRPGSSASTFATFATFAGGTSTTENPTPAPAQPAPRIDPRLERALEALERRCPDHVTAADWRQAIEDGRRFLATWGDQAEALDWSACDLFGLHEPPERPASTYRRLSRVDQTGLIWQLQGRAVLSLTDASAAIRTPSGSILTYRRRAAS